MPHMLGVDLGPCFRFTGLTGQAIISKTAAYLITDSRYWVQAANQIDSSWQLIQAGHANGPKDWVEWLVDRGKDTRIGIDARTLCCAKAIELNSQLSPKGSKLVSPKLVYPPQNLIDLVWKGKPLRPKDLVYVHHPEFTGKSTPDKLANIRTLIRNTPPIATSYSSAPIEYRYNVATLITALDSVGEQPYDSMIGEKTYRSIAYILNLRGSDIPFNPLFYSYLLITLDKAILFIDPAKLTNDVEDYLKAVGVDTKEYHDLWSYLRRREWGEGKVSFLLHVPVSQILSTRFFKVIIAPETSYAIALMLTNFRYTVMPSFVRPMEAAKNDTEIEGLRRAYLRDGASFVRFLAWLEDKLASGYDITEYEAAFRLIEYRRSNRHFIGLAYEDISASGPNAALPLYSPTRSTAAMIDREAPYSNDSGGWYKDGVCGTARTWIFGRPTADHYKAYTRVLQRHIAIDSAIFPEGTSGHQLDVLAGRGPRQGGVDLGPETGHGVGFLNVHEGLRSFSNNVTLVPGHVITNEPGFCESIFVYTEGGYRSSPLDLPGKFGIRMKSALVVRRVAVKPEFGDGHWLGFERLTCVPIQTKMIKGGMLTKDEKQWVKEHNRRCWEKLEPYLRNDKRASRWLKREAEPGLGISLIRSGGISIGRG